MIRGTPDPVEAVFSLISFVKPIANHVLVLVDLVSLHCLEAGDDFIQGRILLSNASLQGEVQHFLILLIHLVNDFLAEWETASAQAVVDLSILFGESGGGRYECWQGLPDVRLPEVLCSVMLSSCGRISERIEYGFRYLGVTVPISDTACGVGDGLGGGFGKVGVQVEDLYGLCSIEDASVLELSSTGSDVLQIMAVQVTGEDVIDDGSVRGGEGTVAFRSHGTSVLLECPRPGIVVGSPGISELERILGVDDTDEEIAVFTLVQQLNEWHVLENHLLEGEFPDDALAGELPSVGPSDRAGLGGEASSGIFRGVRHEEGGDLIELEVVLSAHIVQHILRLDDYITSVGRIVPGELLYLSVEGDDCRCHQVVIVSTLTCRVKIHEFRAEPVKASDVGPATKSVASDAVLLTGNEGGAAHLVEQIKSPVQPPA